MKLYGMYIPISDWENLPVEFRVQIPETDQEGLEKLKSSLVEWADLKGFKLVLKI